MAHSARHAPRDKEQHPASLKSESKIPSSLRAAFGHKNLGVYLIVREGGQIAVGDSVFVPRVAAAQKSD